MDRSRSAPNKGSRAPFLFRSFFFLVFKVTKRGKGYKPQSKVFFLSTFKSVFKVTSLITQRFLLAASGARWPGGQVRGAPWEAQEGRGWVPWVSGAQGPLRLQGADPGHTPRREVAAARGPWVPAAPQLKSESPHQIRSAQRTHSAPGGLSARPTHPLLQGPPARLTHRRPSVFLHAAGPKARRLPQDGGAQKTETAPKSEAPGGQPCPHGR